MKWISGRVILAAAKLALIYGVLLLVGFALFFTLFAWGQTFRVADLAGALLVLAIPFGTAFLLLAIARRAGFVALWTILLVFWGFVVSLGGMKMPHLIPLDFAVWSMLALPLWIIGHAGLRDPSSRKLRIGPFTFSPATMVLSCWLLLLASSRLFGLFQTSIVIVSPPRPPDLALWTLWAPAPLWISAFAVRHVWRGTAALPAGEAVSAA